MASEWHTYRLDELCEFINGFAFKSTDYIPCSADTVEVFRMGYIERGGGFKEDSSPVFVPKKYKKNIEKYFLYPGDITIAMTDMKDRVAILGNTAQIRDENRFVLNQRVGCIRVKKFDLLDPRFLYFYSNWTPYVDYLRSRANSGVQVNLSTSAIKEVDLHIPPLAEQRAIAHILGTLDDKIELNRKQNETLEAMARALFKAWFVDFEPVRAKMEGRWQRGQSLPGLPAHLYDLFPDRLVDSELGEIPEAWMVKPLQKLLAESKERVDVGSLTSENYISTENMLANRGGITTASSLPSEKTVPAFKKNDVLISNIRPYFKKIWVASCNGGHSPDVLCFRAANNNIQKYLHQLISQDTFFDFMMQTSKGAKMPRGDKSAIMKWNVVFPDMKLASHFSEMLEPFYGQIQAQTQANSNLAQLRDTLLPTLVSGELRVNDVGAQHAVPLQNGERE